MTRDTFLLVYGAVIHIAALVSLVVLVALSKVSWAEAGPIIGGLIGVGIGVPLQVAKTTPTVIVADPPKAPPPA